MSDEQKASLKMVLRSPSMRGEYNVEGVTPTMWGHVMMILHGKPISMVLHCPKCGKQHIDTAEDLPMPMPGSAFEGSAGWTNPPHRSHLCHDCGHIWRPADIPTVGVAKVETVGKNDSPLLTSTFATPTVVLLHDFQTHRDSWRNMLEIAFGQAHGEDANYFEHELKAYDKAMKMFDKVFEL